MNILAFDTCFGACSVAVGRVDDAGKLDVCSNFQSMDSGHAERLMPMIAETLSLAGIDARDISRIAVTLGPGTFTGTRIGIAAARAFALATRADVVATTSLAVMASTARCDPELVIQHNQLLVAADARRGQVYAQLFGADGLDPKHPPMLVSYADAVQLGAPGAMTIVGTGAAEVLGQALHSGRTINSGLPLLQPHAASLCAMALSLTPVRGAVTPLYLRPPDAKPQSGKSLERSGQ